MTTGDITGRTGNALPSRVRVGDAPRASTINGIIDALGDRQIRMGGMPFREGLARGVVRMTFATPINLVATSGGAATTFNADGTIELLTKPEVLDADADLGTITAKAAGVYLLTCNVFAASSWVDHFSRWRVLLGTVAEGWSPLPLVIQATRDGAGFLTGYVRNNFVVRDTICLSEIVRLDAETELSVSVELFDINSAATVDFTCNHFAALYLGAGDAYVEPEE